MLTDVVDLERTKAWFEFLLRYNKYWREQNVDGTWQNPHGAVESAEDTLLWMQVEVDAGRR